jgi:hypothetical protein
MEVSIQYHKYKLFNWSFYTFYPDLSHGYMWEAGELRCFKLEPGTTFSEDRRCAFLRYNGELLWPMSANKPMNLKYGKQFDFYCYHLDDLKPPINQLHRNLRRILYRSFNENPSIENIKVAVNQLGLNKNETEYNGEYLSGRIVLIFRWNFIHIRRENRNI